MKNWQKLEVWQKRCCLTDIDKTSATMKNGNSKLLIRNLRKMKEQETEKQALDLSNVSDWVAVDDALPNHGEEVLTVTEDNWYRITQFGSIGKGKFPSQVTHWMRLPKPPCR